MTDLPVSSGLSPSVMGFLEARLTAEQILCSLEKLPSLYNFPANLYRELLRKWLQDSRFLLWNRLAEPRNRKFPYKISC